MPEKTKLPEEKRIIRRLRKISYLDNKAVSEVESDIWQSLKKNPENTACRILWLSNLLMQGKRDEAVSVAGRIWADGGSISENIKFIYINCLIGMGLNVMAQMLLDDVLETKEKLSAEELAVCVNYVLFTGDNGILPKIISLCRNKKQGDLLQAWEEDFSQNGYWPHYRMFQNIIERNLKNSRCFCSGFVGENAGTKLLSCCIYANLRASGCLKQEEIIQRELKAYCTAKKMTESPAFLCSVRPLELLAQPKSPDRPV